MMEVDFFKQYNDTYGHSAGDECLKMIAKTIQREVEDTNGFAARFGGKECRRDDVTLVGFRI